MTSTYYFLSRLPVDMRSSTRANTDYGALSRQTFHARLVSFEDVTDKRRVFGQHCLQTLEVWVGLTVALCLSTFPLSTSLSVSR